MSAYQINKICRSVLHDRSFRADILKDPAAAIADFRLTEDERNAFLKADVARLYQFGASGFLLLILPRFNVLGLTFDSYNKQMLAIASPEK